MAAATQRRRRRCCPTPAAWTAAFLAPTPPSASATTASATTLDQSNSGGGDHKSSGRAAGGSGSTGLGSNGAAGSPAAAAAAGFGLKDGGESSRQEVLNNLNQWRMATADAAAAWTAATAANELGMIDLAGAASSSDLTRSKRPRLGQDGDLSDEHPSWASALIMSTAADVDDGGDIGGRSPGSSRPATPSVPMDTDHQDDATAGAMTMGTPLLSRSLSVSSLIGGVAGTTRIKHRQSAYTDLVSSVLLGDQEVPAIVDTRRARRQRALAVHVVLHLGLSLEYICGSIEPLTQARLMGECAHFLPEQLQHLQTLTVALLAKSLLVKPAAVPAPSVSIIPPAAAATSTTTATATATATGITTPTSSSTAPGIPLPPVPNPSATALFGLSASEFLEALEAVPISTLTSFLPEYPNMLAHRWMLKLGNNRRLTLDCLSALPALYDPASPMFIFKDTPPMGPAPVGAVRVGASGHPNSATFVSRACRVAESSLETYLDAYWYSTQPNFDEAVQTILDRAIVKLGNLLPENIAGHELWSVLRSHLCQRLQALHTLHVFQILYELGSFRFQQSRLEPALKVFVQAATVASLPSFADFAQLDSASIRARLALTFSRQERSPSDADREDSGDPITTVLGRAVHLFSGLSASSYMSLGRIASDADSKAYALRARRKGQTAMTLVGGEGARPKLPSTAFPFAWPLVTADAAVVDGFISACKAMLAQSHLSPFSSTQSAEPPSSLAEAVSGMLLSSAGAANGLRDFLSEDKPAPFSCLDDLALLSRSPAIETTKPSVARPSRVLPQSTSSSSHSHNGHATKGMSAQERARAAATHRKRLVELRQDLARQALIASNRTSTQGVEDQALPPVEIGSDLLLPVAQARAFWDLTHTMEPEVACRSLRAIFRLPDSDSVTVALLSYLDTLVADSVTKSIVDAAGPKFTLAGLLGGSPSWSSLQSQANAVAAFVLVVKAGQARAVGSLSTAAALLNFATQMLVNHENKPDSAVLAWLRFLVQAAPRACSFDANEWSFAASSPSTASTFQLWLAVEWIMLSRECTLKQHPCGALALRLAHANEIVASSGCCRCCLSLGGSQLVFDHENTPDSAAGIVFAVVNEMSSPQSTMALSPLAVFGFLGYAVDHGAIGVFRQLEDVVNRSSEALSFRSALPALRVLCHHSWHALSAALDSEASQTHNARAREARARMVRFLEGQQRTQPVPALDLNALHTEIVSCLPLVSWFVTGACVTAPVLSRVLLTVAREFNLQHAQQSAAPEEQTPVQSVCAIIGTLPLPALLPVRPYLSAEGLPSARVQPVRKASALDSSPPLASSKLTGATLLTAMESLLHAGLASSPCHPNFLIGLADVQFARGRTHSALSLYLAAGRAVSGNFVTLPPNCWSSGVLGRMVLCSISLGWLMDALILCQLPLAWPWLHPEAATKIRENERSRASRALPDSNYPSQHSTPYLFDNTATPGFYLGPAFRALGEFLVEGATTPMNTLADLPLQLGGPAPSSTVPSNVPSSRPANSTPESTQKSSEPFGAVSSSDTLGANIAGLSTAFWCLRQVRLGDVPTELFASVWHVQLLEAVANVLHFTGDEGRVAFLASALNRPELNVNTALSVRLTAIEALTKTHLRGLCSRLQL
ncbi:hypothetical protein CAOG_02478 [Capsaspora owczarzaki ATCC 30864]|uniref:INTS8 TPR repeats domain-containing protein n=1 Tax=Capsaspora owczarzaki (strain ATCC 30864) TaxID=595528 RepID=A0A0D2U893_CAPO3|nr:hypothetical protein CAOG_02478 [Capsaspora owczarzaki ATCC 30864]KJE91326.1 hypothetical protein CAOG_002478 [Capsaspora owczarzaki ATCC 30864]|eukprot:XP_004349228.2 hypothetical protein CAOG_02478 [Capsaspora owczarzaki ATCC 30864]